MKHYNERVLRNEAGLFFRKMVDKYSIKDPDLGYATYVEEMRILKILREELLAELVDKRKCIAFEHDELDKKATKALRKGTELHKQIYGRPEEARDPGPSIENYGDKRGV